MWRLDRNSLRLLPAHLWLGPRALTVDLCISPNVSTLCQAIQAVLAYRVRRSNSTGIRGGRPPR